jgi:hypothetical protein
MVLEMIDPKKRKLHEDENLQEYTNETAKDAASYAYTDNLATCSAGLQVEYIQQLQVKWFFAFYTFSGLTINPGKIKATTSAKYMICMSPERNQMKRNIFSRH